MPLNDALLLDWIQQNVRERRFEFTAHALEKHPLQERFRPADALAAILAGSILEHREPESRCLVCGEAPGIALDKRFHGRWIHCAIRYDLAQGILIITMYRPRRDAWLTPHMRTRRRTGGGPSC